MMYTPNFSDFHSKSGKVLYISFTLIVVMSLLNILIGIICNSYYNTLDDGTTSFWKDKLIFVNEIDGIQRLLTCICRPFVRAFTKPLEFLYAEPRKDLDELSFGEGRALWDILMVCCRTIFYVVAVLVFKIIVFFFFLRSPLKMHVTIARSGKLLRINTNGRDFLCILTINLGASILHQRLLG